MATASQRYFSFEIGKENELILTNTFSTNLHIYIFFSILIYSLAETFGIWLLNHKLIIPCDRLISAQFVYHFSILSFLATLISTPYLAVIIAHENMDIYAYVSIFDAILKLIVAFIIQFTQSDKLKIYGLLIFSISVLNAIIYIAYCQIRYKESRYKFYWNPHMFRQLFSYTCWNLFGASVGVIKNHGISIILNMYLGPSINAAKSIASQVNSTVVSFSHNFSIAVRPQIVKLYASEKSYSTQNLVIRSSKMTFYLMYIFVLPLFIETHTIMKVWLKEVPPYVIIFTRLILIDSLINSLSYPLMALVQATGKIKLYQTVVGGILLLNLPISYFSLRIGSPPEIVFLIGIILTSFAYFLRLIILRRLTNFPILVYVKRSFFPMLSVMISSLPIPIMCFLFIRNEGIQFICVTVTSLLFTILPIFIYGLDNNERKYIFQLLISVKNRLPSKLINI